MSTLNAVIVIPARYGSTRFPGKPLAKIGNKTLLQHVCDAASNAAKHIPGVELLVATDDVRIMQHAAEINVAAVMTPIECATGTDRVIAAIKQLPHKPQFVINLQGDAPLTPIAVIVALLNALKTDPIVTPVMQLNWSDLDVLRAAKRTNPFSGTSAIVNAQNEALWFSKQIIPAIRSEDKLRNSSPKSPIYQHLGIYGYSLEALEIFASLPLGHYEQLEGLEQLRLLENGYKIKAVPVVLENLYAWRGVDTIEDAQFVEQILEQENFTI
ncbi:MAG TPA: manno-octulosonate cytidylyltransferase [Gammaproteobacteria bacterium]|nr:manno-octulosonate cytidylyltransferase [Gammaproteobacteria bacterium]